MNSKFNIAEAIRDCQEAERKVNCPHCFGMGIQNTPNEFDDYSEEYCDCPNGEKLYQKNAENQNDYYKE